MVSVLKKILQSRCTQTFILRVIGENSVTVIDGSTIQSFNVAELEPNELLCNFGVTVHILPYGYGYDMKAKEVIKRYTGDKDEDY